MLGDMSGLKAFLAIIEASFTVRIDFARSQISEISTMLDALQLG